MAQDTEKTKEKIGGQVVAAKYKFGDVDHIKAKKRAELEADIEDAADHLHTLLGELSNLAKWQDGLWNHLQHLREAGRV